MYNHGSSIISSWAFSFLRYSDECEWIVFGFIDYFLLSLTLIRCFFLSQIMKPHQTKPSPYTTGSLFWYLTWKSYLDCRRRTPRMSRQFRTKPPTPWASTMASSSSCGRCRTSWPWLSWPCLRSWWCWRSCTAAAVATARTSSTPSSLCPRWRRSMLMRNSNFCPISSPFQKIVYQDGLASNS